MVAKEQKHKTHLCRLIKYLNIYYTCKAQLNSIFVCLKLAYMWKIQ